MLTTQVALVPLEKLDDERTEDYRELLWVASALQTQITRDFGPVWGVSAIVTPFLALEHVPPQYSPVIIARKELPRGEHGFHLAADGRPFALVHRGADWSVTASHELMEMVLDPAGVLTASAPSLRDRYYEVMRETPWAGAHDATDEGTIADTVGGAAAKKYKGQGMVDYLVEPCDPVEDADIYTIDGVKVSDFVTPHYYDSFGPTGRRYSFLGTLKEPFQIWDGGYVSWRTHDPRNSVWLAHAEPPDRPPVEPPKPVCGTMSDHLHIGRLKDEDPNGARKPGAPSDDFVSRFSRDQVSAKMTRVKRKGGATAASAATAQTAAAGEATSSEDPESWKRYGEEFRRDVDKVISYLKKSRPTLRDIIHLLEEIDSARKDPADKPVPASREQLDRYGISGKHDAAEGKREDLHTVIALLNQQEEISNILDSNAADPDLASWLCRLMP